MRNPFLHAAGGVVSADIAVSDHDAELEFYSKILTTGGSPLWKADLMNNLAEPIIGLGARTPEYEKIPQHWAPHFQVTDVVASLNCVIEMGGQLLMRSHADDEQCEWAAATDPNGTAFGLIPIVPGEPNNERNGGHFGQIAWLSMNTPDVEASREFYESVIGWKSKSIQVESGGKSIKAFEMQINEETSAAEIYQTSEESIDIPPVWLIHLPVDDLQESVKRVIEAGGSVLQESDGTGSVVIRDPIGVCIALRAS